MKLSPTRDADIPDVEGKRVTYKIHLRHLLSSVVVSETKR